MSLWVCLALWVLGVSLLLVGIALGQSLLKVRARWGFTLSGVGLCLMALGMALTTLARPV